VETVPIGLLGLAEQLREMLRAIKSKAIFSRGDLSRDLVADYFERRTVASGATLSDVIASASHSYARLICTAIPEFKFLFDETQTSTVIDFGCGNAALLQVLRRLGFAGDYIGYDINTAIISKLGIERVADDSQKYTSILPSSGADVVFLINVLAYTTDNDIPDLLRSVAALVKSSGILIVADPSPSWRWETRFDRLSLRLRRLDDVDIALCDLGFKLRESWQASVGSLYGHTVLPFAWLGAWRNDRSL